MPPEASAERRQAARRHPVSELERRYGRPAEQVLERLRMTRVARGEITPEDVNEIAAELRLPRAHVAGAASFYSDFGPGRRARRHVRVCAGTACFAATRGAHIDAAEQRLGAHCGDASADGEVSLERVYCLGYCYACPAALDGDRPRTGPDLVDQLAGSAPERDPDIPLACAAPEPVVLAGLCGSGPEAWSVWPELARSGDGSRVLDEVLRSGLRGRGGAGFPAARKWEAAAKAASDGPRYVVANGDEGDPGSFADRVLMERDPHHVLEGLALAGLACGASVGYVYVRSEYPRALEAMRLAVGEARAAGYLAPEASGSGPPFDVEVVEGAGSYVAGEETSLIHSLEGLRGSAAARPPFPVEHGLHQRPTVVNNVETLAAVPWILARGGDAYRRLGTPDDPGTKLVSLNERFRRPGAYEVELGTSLRVICEDLGGGLRDGRRLRSLQVGGPLGGFLSPEQLDTPLSLSALQGAGAALGHAGLVAFDEQVPAVELLRHTWRFAADESCGACFPCRIGSRRGLELAEEMAHDGADPRRLDVHEHVANAMGPSLCAFGQSVPQAVRSIVRVYADELTSGGGA